LSPLKALIKRDSTLLDALERREGVDIATLKAMTEQELDGLLRSLPS
jgi:hypothetical protein